MILHDLYESKMSELDIEYQDFVNKQGKGGVSDKEFQDAYGMTRTEWAKKNKEWTWQKERQPVAPDAHVMHEGNPNSDPWIVYDEMQPGKIKKFATRDGAQAFAERHGYNYASFGFYHDVVKQRIEHEYNNRVNTSKMPDAVDEGRQTFGKYDPHWVCINGKKWKRFETYEHARAVHDKLEKKLRSEGSDKKVSLLADLDEASWVDGKIGDPKDLVWKQTSMSYEDAVKEFGADHVRKEGKARDGHTVIAVLVPRGPLEETKTDYQKRRRRERDVDTGKPVAKQRSSKMTDYQKKRAQDKKDMELGESALDDPKLMEWVAWSNNTLVKLSQTVRALYSEKNADILAKYQAHLGSSEDSRPSPQQIDWLVNVTKHWIKPGAWTAQEDEWFQDLDEVVGNDAPLYEFARESDTLATEIIPWWKSWKQEQGITPNAIRQHTSMEQTPTVHEESQHDRNARIVAGELEDAVKQKNQELAKRKMQELTKMGFYFDNQGKLRAHGMYEGLRDPKDNPCWKGYKPVGTKQKAGKTVPNCVPKE